MSSKLPSRAVHVAVLRARDPSTLSLEEAYEIYRADFARELRTAERAFRGETRQLSPNPALTLLCDGAILAAGVSALAFAIPLPDVCAALARDGRGLTLLLAALLATGAWAVRRRVSGAAPD
jgi:hypothetical protein